MLQALSFALKDLLHDRSRSLLSVIGLAVVVASYLVLLALANALGGALQATAVSRNLVVIQNDVIDPSDAVLEPQVIQAAQALIPEMVSRVSPLVVRHMRIGGRVVQLRAAAVEDWQPVYHLALVQGSWPSQEDEVAVGEGLALSNGWQVGSTVTIFGSQFRIAGIFRSPSIVFASLWMPVQSYWAVFNEQSRYQALTVQAAAGVDAERLLRRLQDDPRLSERYAVYFEDSYSSRNMRALQDLSSLMKIASAAALLGIVLGVYNASAMSSVERSREIGILRGIGFSHPAVQRLLWLRVTVLALAAYACGVGLAFLFLASQNALAPLIILSVPFTLRLSPAMLLGGLAWAAGLSLAGGWLSTRRLLRRQVTDLLRGT